MTRIGSLFSGYGGLDLAVQSVVGGDVAWVSDICKVNKDGTVGHYEPHRSPCTILAHHHADVPNLGDIAAVDWSQVDPVDVLTLGFPCTDLSTAGKRLGLKPGTRSGLWTHAAYAISQLRPRLVVIENVRGLLSAEAHSDVEPCPWCVGDDSDGVLRALGAVLGDLADLGYDAQWVGVRAADVGAPHGRFRVFVAAYPAGNPWRLSDRDGRDAADAQDDRRASQQPSGCQPARPRPARADGIAAHTGGIRREPGRPAGPGEAEGGRAFGEPAGRGRRAVADASGDGRDEGRPESARLIRRPDAPERSDAPAPDAERVGLTGRGELRHLGSPPADRTDQGVQRQRDRDAVDDRGAATPDAEGDEQREHVIGLGQRTEPGRSGNGTDWGAYEPAIRRWEHVLGRVAPAPTEAGAKGGQRLSPAFVEWMMGLPAGHVTAVPGLTRSEQLKALGNGVVLQQAAAGLTHLLQPTSRKEVA